MHAGNWRRRSRASAPIGLACLCKRRRSRRRHAVGLLHPHNTTSCKEKMALIVCMRRRIGRSKEKKSLTERMHFGLIKFYYTGLACPLFTTHPFSNRSVLNGLVPTPHVMSSNTIITTSCLLESARKQRNTIIITPLARPNHFRKISLGKLSLKIMRLLDDYLFTSICFWEHWFPLENKLRFLNFPVGYKKSPVFSLLTFHRDPPLSIFI